MGGGSKLKYRKNSSFLASGPDFLGFLPIHENFFIDAKTFENFENFNMYDVMMTSSLHTVP